MIHVRNVTKDFHTVQRVSGVRGALRSLIAPHRVVKQAVSDASFTVPEGQLVSLLGPNGAGKSTLIKMLTGIVVPTSGEVTVAGLVPHKNRERNAYRIGAVFGQRTQLWWDLPAKQSFAVLRDIYGIDPGAYSARLREFDDLLNLSQFWDTRVRHLSLGQRVRCDLAAALLHDPPVVFLDEPTIGMDAVVKEQVREFVRAQVQERGRTVLLTTHDMGEVERLSSRVLVINRGRIVLDSTLREIRADYGGSWRIRIGLRHPGEEPNLPEGLHVISRAGTDLLVGAGQDALLSPQQAIAVIAKQVPAESFSIEAADLEEVMREVYTRAGARPGASRLPASALQEGREG
ncbi:ATP-binding cassette domain-containing protein [Streptomyces sp. NPDC006552]|uniref:ABC transporter ATP-binding protein n=1 Tax=Streptomyces sp. NPDC006552 TaxID=3157179 RepID=UPI0033BCE713